MGSLRPHKRGGLALGESEMIPRFVFDLQFFAQERTESATPKKREKVRSEGKVCKSRDLTSAIELLAGLIALGTLGSWICEGLTDYFRGTFAFMGDVALFQPDWFQRLEFSALSTYFTSWLFLGLAIAVLATAVTIKQVGWKISFEPFQLKFDRMNPISGMKKLISIRALVELLKGLVKAGLFAIVIYAALRDKLPEILRAMQVPLEYGALRLWDQLWWLSLRLAVMLLIIGLADYAYQKWDFEKSIRMSKQEIKDEFKQMEGDPQIKNKIRQKQRELAKKRMMSSVPKSDVVITNPTTLAIALMYDRAVMAAPQVTAKGKGAIARKIREVAETHGVLVMENKPLAWALYESTEVGDEVPENLYRGVAEILAMVYKLKNRQGTR